MRLLSYIVARDYGFAPNPFHGCCTLATCKPRVRSSANIGDWIAGIGAKTKYDFAGRLIYAMKVDEVMGFDSYWNDPRFPVKRPVLFGSLKQLYGDNIYHKSEDQWIQADSHHSLATGEPNPENIEDDTKADRMLIARRFVYFGEDAPWIPKQFCPYQPTSESLCFGRGHRAGSHQFAVAFESWLDERDKWGVQGMPLEFKEHNRIDRGG